MFMLYGQLISVKYSPSIKPTQNPLYEDYKPRHFKYIPTSRTMELNSRAE